MHWLTLPEPSKTISPAFHDKMTAKLWLAEQLDARPLQTLAAIRLQIEAIDGAIMPPTQAIELLSILRTAAVPLLADVAPRFVRKPLPLPEDDQRAFEITQLIWLRLGIAFLRRAPHFAPADKCLHLHRAATALRLAQYAHFQASHELPPLIDRLLFSVLAQAERHGLLRQAVSDPDFPQLGTAHIAGILSWAYLLRLSDPYHMSTGQLTVANRALRRWRELPGFQVTPDHSPKAQLLDLSPLFGGPLPEGIPRWLEVRNVSRKIRQRIDSLNAGETPEALKLGSELSSQACIAVLEQINRALHNPFKTESEESGPIELVFGGADAFALIRGELLSPPPGKTVQHTPLSYQRMAMFGHERDGDGQVSSVDKELVIPGEQWMLQAGRASRVNGENLGRHLSNSLIAASIQGKVRLGILQALQTGPGGHLSARLKWFAEQVEAGKLKRTPQHDPRQPSIPVFILRDEKTLSALLPISAGARLGVGLVLESTSVEHLLPTSVIERGVDFIRYACQAA
ncbi:hypothetical protein KI614_15410 [Dechloromonas denitrificans]|uniref:hypothetical protein n=1 Tax=Dechloromonas denitrificans TaxID=281362 RepID=UPI001CF8177C|nr:hypothetical protein [Dechloromonas denitrificans]UCV11505.1 hypothetical protein KI614_15410 [Dechloromonas denitrificans]